MGVARANIGQVAWAELAMPEPISGAGAGSQGAQLHRPRPRWIQAEARAAQRPRRRCSVPARGGRAAAAVSHRLRQRGGGGRRIRAPFDGVVLVKNASVGDLITQSLGRRRQQGRGGESMADHEHAGSRGPTCRNPTSCRYQARPALRDPARCLPSLRFRGEVNRLVPAVDRTKAGVMTEIRFLDPDHAGAAGDERQGGVSGRGRIARAARGAHRGA